MYSFVLICAAIALLFTCINMIYVYYQDESEESKGHGYLVNWSDGNERSIIKVPQRTETKYETIKDEGKTFIVRKEYHICLYCRSRSETTSLYCEQCGAPAD